MSIISYNVYRRFLGSLASLLRPVGFPFLADFFSFLVGHIGQCFDGVIHVILGFAKPDLSHDEAMLLAEGNAVIDLGIIHEPADLALGWIVTKRTFGAGYFTILHGFFPRIKFP